MTLNEPGTSLLGARAAFRRAAETCFISQPTLSVAVKKLETELGLEPEAPQGRSVSPRWASRLSPRSSVLEEASSIRQIARRGTSSTGPLRLGAIYTIGPLSAATPDSATGGRARRRCRW